MPAEGLKAGDDCPASCGGRLYDLKEPTLDASYPETNTVPTLSPITHV